MHGGKGVTVHEPEGTLAALPTERLNSMAYFYGISLPEVPEDDYGPKLAELIASHLLIPANALVAMNGLNDEEILALRMITISGGGSGVIVEQCHQKLNQLAQMAQERVQGNRRLDLQGPCVYQERRVQAEVFRAH